MDKLKLPSFDGITRVVCLDLGDGECAAFAVKLISGILDTEPYELTFERGSKKNEPELPSVISYKMNPETRKFEPVCVGDLIPSEGSENYVSVVNFKRNPVNDATKANEINWMGTHSSLKNAYKELADKELSYEDFKKSYQDECTYRKIMKDFIGCLWENLKKNNSNDTERLPKNFNNEETMIFAACPSSSIWMDHRDQYSELISEATGIDQKNIHIFRESDVAAYRTLKNADESLTLDQGIVVIDCGSSTLDFSYVINGEIKQAKSCTLGAGMIEHLMFDKMKMDFEKSDKQNERELFEYFESRKNIDYYLFRTRGVKEAYFSPIDKTKKTEKRNFFFDAPDEVLKYNVSVTVDDAFMDEVLSKPVGDRIMCDGKRLFTELGSDYNWKQCFVKFLEQRKESLNGDRIDRIVLTGGASRMYFIEELCKKVFEGIYVEKDDHPYSCVSFGLSRLAYNMFNVEKVIRKEASGFKDDDFRDVKEACEKIGKKIDSYLIKKRDAAINNLMKKEKEVHVEGYYESESLRKAINDEINDFVSKSGIERAVENEVKEFRSVLSKRFQEASDRCARELYRRDSVGSIRVDDIEIFGKYEDEKSPIFPDDRCYSDFSIYDRLSWSEKSKRKNIFVNKLYTSISTNAVGLFPTEFSLVGWAIKKWNESQQVKFEAVRSVAKLSDFQYDADIRQHTPRILKAINIPIPGYSYSNYFEPFKTVNVEFLCDVYFKCIKEMIMRVALLLDYECDMRPIFGKPSFDSYNEYTDYDPIKDRTSI